MANEKKGGDAKKSTGGTTSRTARRSMGDVKTAPKAVAWAWERGIRVGQGRKPDYHIFNEADVAAFDPGDFIVIKANSAWIGGATVGQRK